MATIFNEIVGELKTVATASVALANQEGDVIKPAQHFDEQSEEMNSLFNLTSEFDTSPQNGYPISDDQAGAGFKTRIDLTTRGQKMMMHCDRLLKTLDPQHWLTMEGHLDFKLITETYDIFQSCTKINFERKSGNLGRGFCKYSTSMALVANFKAILVSMYKWVNVYVDWVNLTMFQLASTSDTLSKCKKTTLPIEEILFMLRYFFLWGQEESRRVPQDKYNVKFYLTLFQRLVQEGSKILPLPKSAESMVLHDFNYDLPSEGVLAPSYVGQLSDVALAALETEIAGADLKRQSFRAIMELALLKINWEGPLSFIKKGADTEIFRNMFGIYFQKQKFQEALKVHAMSSTNNIGAIFVTDLSDGDCTLLTNTWQKLHSKHRSKIIPHQKEILDCFAELTKVFFTVDVNFSETSVTNQSEPIWKCDITCWPVELFECLKGTKISSIQKGDGKRQWKKDIGNPHYQMTLLCNYHSQGAELHFLIDNHTQYHQVNKYDPSPSIDIDGIEADPHYTPDTTYNDSYASFGEDPSSSLSSLSSTNNYRIGYTHGVDLLLSWLKFQTINRSVKVAPHPEAFSVSLWGDLRRFKNPSLMLDIAEQGEEVEQHKFLTGTLPRISANYNWNNEANEEKYLDYTNSAHGKFLFSGINLVQTYCNALLALNHLTSSDKNYTTNLTSNIILQNDYALTNLFSQNVFQILLEEQIWRPRPFIINNGSRSFKKTDDILSVLKSRVMPTFIKAKGLTAAIQSIQNLTWKTSNYGKTSADEEILISQRTESMAQLAVYGHLEKLLMYPKIIFPPKLLDRFKMNFEHKKNTYEASKNGQPVPDELGREFDLSASEEILFSLYETFQSFFESDDNLTWEKLQTIIAEWPGYGQSLKNKLEKFDYSTLLKIISNGATPMDGLNYDQYYNSGVTASSDTPKFSRKMIYSVIYEKLVHIFIKLRSMNFRKASLNKQDSFKRFKFLNTFEKEEVSALDGGDYAHEGLNTLSNLKTILDFHFSESENLSHDGLFTTAAVERFEKKLDYLLKKEPEPSCRIFVTKDSEGNVNPGKIKDVFWCLRHFTNSPKSFLTIGGLEYLAATLAELKESEDDNSIFATNSDGTRIKIMGSCSQLLNYTFKPKWVWMQPVFASFIRENVLVYEKSADPKKTVLPFPPALPVTNRTAIYQSLLDKIEKHCLLQLASCYACLKPFGEKFKSATNSSELSSIFEEGNMDFSKFKQALKHDSKKAPTKLLRNRAIRLIKELRKLKVGYISPITNSDCPELVKKIPIFSDRMQICRSVVGKADGKNSQLFEPDVYNIDTGVKIPEHVEEEENQQVQKAPVKEKETDMVDLTLSPDTIISTPQPSSSRQVVTSNMDQEDEEYSWDDEELGKDNSELMRLVLIANKENENNSNSLDSKEDPIDTTRSLREAYNLNLTKDYKFYFSQEKASVLPLIIQTLLEEQGQEVDPASQEFQAIVKEEEILMTDLLKDESFNIGSEGESWTFLRKFLQWLKTWVMVQYRHEMLVAFATSIIQHAILYDPVAIAKTVVSTVNTPEGGDDEREDETEKSITEGIPSSTFTEVKPTKQKKKVGGSNAKLARNYETLSVLQGVFFAEQNKAQYPVKSLHKVIKLLETVRAFELEDTVDKARNLCLAFSLKEKIQNPKALGDEILEGLKILFSRPVGGSWFHNALYTGLSNIPAPSKSTPQVLTPWNMFDAGTGKITKINSYIWDFLSDNAYGRYLIGPQRHWALDWKDNAFSFARPKDDILYGTNHFFDFDLFRETVDPDMSGFGFLPPLEAKMSMDVVGDQSRKPALAYLQGVQTSFFEFLAGVLQYCRGSTFKKNPGELLSELLKDVSGENDNNSFLVTNTDYFKQIIKKVTNSLPSEGEGVRSPIWDDISNIFSETVYITNNLEEKQEDARSLEPIEWLFVTMWTTSCNASVNHEEGLIKDPSKALEVLSFLPMLPFAQKMDKKLGKGKSNAIQNEEELIKPPVTVQNETEGSQNWDDYEVEDGDSEDNDDEGESATNSSSSNSRTEGRMKLIGPRSRVKEVPKGGSDSISEQKSSKKKKEKKSTGKDALMKVGGDAVVDALKQKEDEKRKAELEAERVKEKEILLKNPPVDTPLSKFAKHHRSRQTLTFNVTGVMNAILLYLDEYARNQENRETVRKIVNSLACTVNLLVLGGIMVRDFHDHGSLLARYNMDTMTPKWDLGKYEQPAPKLPVSLAGFTSLTTTA